MSDNDLIRRGDALDAAWEADSLELSTHGAGKIEARIKAIPAVQPTVSPDVAALVEALVEALEQAKDFIDDQYTCAESQAVQGEYVAKEARQLWYMLCDTLARVKGVMW